MKLITRVLLSLSLFAFFIVSGFADDLSKLEGKWSIKKTNREGQAYTQTLEIKKDKFKFRVVGGDDQTQLYAEGDIKLSKLGAFNAIKFFNIKGGTSADSLEPVDDDRDAIYMLDGNSWTLASNFDKPRDDQKPTADTYTRSSK